MTADNKKRCNSSYFYIKPQLCEHNLHIHFVVIHLISTSNHNVQAAFTVEPSVVIHLISTSNHNGIYGSEFCDLL